MRGRFVLFLMVLAPVAMANGVMGYALEQYDGRAWLVYVAATIAFEAWAIGRKSGFGWPVALGISVLANLVTAGCCVNLCGVGLHTTFVGSRLNPKPLLNMVLMFSVFALLSGMIEAIVWRLFDRREGLSHALFFRVVGAHLAWIVPGIAIMLVPARPYPFLEVNALNARRFYVIRLRSALDAKIAERGRIPDYRDAFRFFREVVPAMGPGDPDAWVVPYRPDFGRFATGQERGEPLFEWNAAASGIQIDQAKAPKRIWLLRTRADSRRTFGLVWDGAGVSFANGPHLLGYDSR